jgi:hypothetical protein
MTTPDLPPLPEPFVPLYGDERRKWIDQMHAYAAAAVLAERERVVKGIGDHIEQQLHAWRQRLMNESGDRLALDDFMDEESINDLVDFVCDQWALEAAIRAAAEHVAETRKPLTEREIYATYATVSVSDSTLIDFARAIERAHGIGEQQP